jgi:hypothetical protein
MTCGRQSVGFIGFGWDVKGRLFSPKASQARRFDGRREKL